MTDEKATLAAELTGAKAAIRRTNRAKEESTRKLRATSSRRRRRCCTPRPGAWADLGLLPRNHRPRVTARTERAPGPRTPRTRTPGRTRWRTSWKKSEGDGIGRKPPSPSLQSALASARKQSHADHERAIEERRTLKALASALELERDSLRVTLKGRADLAADLTARARRDAGVIAGFKARCDRAHRELKQEKDAVARLAKRLAESERERGSARARMETATATASRVTREAAAATAEVETARADAAKAAIDATAARHELESATRARDVAVEDAAVVEGARGRARGDDRGA